MGQLFVTVNVNDRMTRCQKILVILRNYPEVRNSYDLIISQYYKEYPDDWCSRHTIERDIRAVQYDLGIFPPTARVRKARKDKQKEIIAEAKAKE